MNLCIYSRLYLINRQVPPGDVYDSPVIMFDYEMDLLYLSKYVSKASHTPAAIYQMVARDYIAVEDNEEIYDMLGDYLDLLWEQYLNAQRDTL